MLVDRRTQTITPLQALAQLNNQLALAMAKHFAERIAKAGTDPAARINEAFHIAFQRDPTAPNAMNSSSMHSSTASRTLADSC